MADIKFFKNLDLKKGLAFWAKPQTSVLGIDIGSASVKVAQLRKEKETAVLETYGELAVGPYDGKSIGQPANLAPEKMTELLTDLLKESGVKTNEGMLSIPLRASFMTTIDLPLMSEQELKNAMLLEARRYVPIPLTDVEVDWWEIPESLVLKQKEDGERIFQKRKTTEILLVAIHKEIIEKYRNMAERIGLQVRGFEIENFSIARSSLYQELSPILLIDIGAASTKFTILDYGIVRFSHQIPQGSQNLTLALMHSTGGDFAFSEETKRKIGLSDRPENQEAANTIKPILEFIFSEAKKVMSDYRRHSRRSVNHAVLSGGGALLKNLVNFSANALGIETDLANPFQRVAYPAFLEPVLKEIGPSFAVAIGLALRGLKEE